MNRREFILGVGLGALLCGCSGTICSKRNKGEKVMDEFKNNIAACGMDCDACPILRAANDRNYAEKLAEDWRKNGYPKAEADWFKCQGCHGPKSLVWTEYCKIRKCCIEEKKLENCSSCKEFPCKLITKFENDGNSNHKFAVERLKNFK